MLSVKSSKAMRKYSYTILLLFLVFPTGAYALVGQAAIVNINTADAVLLDTLPGIGPSKAAAIVEYRTIHGLFTRIEDIQNVKGIGPSTYAGFKTLITVEDTDAIERPSPPAPSSYNQQTVEPALTTKTSKPVHAAKAVNAPRATNTLAVLGALVPEASSTSSETNLSDVQTSGIFNSPWTLCFLGIVVLAGGALMIL